jgi:SAM-dependent methyltransferase
MTVTRCPCEYERPAGEEVIDHPMSVFEPQGSRGNDGRVHHEQTALTCTCGFTAAQADDFHDHFLTVFTPADLAGRGRASQVDLSRPGIARVYDRLLGGKDHLPADRTEVARLLATCPELADLAVDGRAFVLRAVPWVVRQGVRRFIDLGCGLPAADGSNIHEVAQAVDPAAQVAYVDRDPLVMAHARAQLADGSLAVQADLRQPSAVVRHPVVQRFLGAGERVGIVLGHVLPFLSPDKARQVVQVLARAVAPGSYLIASVGVADPETRKRVAPEYTADETWNHSVAAVAGFFDGLDMVAPGVVLARDWVPAAAVAPLPAITGARALAVVARTPGASPP